ncbi:MAG TPA: hypothetical protein VGO57_11605 [Verrucomicrobiae bacterium]|jgi:hypothetical protein
MTVIEKKLLELVKRIENKTNSDALNWEKTAEQNEFQTTLANFVVRIREYYEYGEDDPNYVIKIISSDGTILESISNADLYRIYNQLKDKESEQHPYSMFVSIFAKAKRQALEVDKAIDNILSELA